MVGSLFSIYLPAMRWMAMVLGLGLVCAGCKGDKKDEPVEVATDEAKAEEGEKKDEDEEEAAKDDGAEGDGETKTAKADEDDKDEDDKDEDDKDEDDKDEDDKDEDAEDGETKTAKADEGKAASTAATKAAPFGAGGLSACCAALDVQSKSTSGSNASRIAAASRQCFHLDTLVAQGKTTKGAALSQLKALSGVAPAACN